MPTAPVPAKMSRKCAPSTSGPRTLKSVSRKRSLVGRSAGPLRLFSKRLRYLPAITRMNVLASADSGQLVTPLPLGRQNGKGPLENLAPGQVFGKRKSFLARLLEEL